MLKTVFVCFALLTIPANAAAQDSAPAAKPSTPPTVEMVRNYISIAGGDDLLVDALFYEAEAAASHSGSSITADQGERLMALLRVHLRNANQILLDDLTIYYGRHSSAEDLQAALAFYGTTGGQRYIHTYMSMMTRYVAYAQSGSTLPPIPDTETLDTARVEKARAIWTILVARLNTQQMLRAQRAGIDVARFGRFAVATLAQNLSLTELDAAYEWASSEAATHLEGGDPARTEAAAAAMRHAASAVDMNALRPLMLAILSEGPT